MSWWSYINGAITVAPMGRTQAEKRYVLDSCLSHLPRVTGSEGDMNVYVIQKNGHNLSSSHDEFGKRTNNLTTYHGDKSRDRGMLNRQTEYILVVDGALRDREFDETFREFMKWIVRLGKRISIENVFVEIKDYEKSTTIKNTPFQKEEYSYKDAFYDLFESPSWSKNNKTGEINWCEYLLWDSMKGSRYPMKLAYKYFNDPENDAEVERRMEYQRGRNAKENK